MKRLIRVGILLIVLAIPALIFLFLHGFGKNKFEVPVFYSDGTPAGLEGCGDRLVPHVITRFPCAKEAATRNSISLIWVVPEMEETNLQLAEIINRLHARFDYTNHVRIAIVIADEIMDAFSGRFLGTENSSEQMEIFACSSEAVKDFIDCQLLLNREYRTFPVVVIDGKGLIRGYFNVIDPKEMERIDAEVKILLNDYE